MASFENEDLSTAFAHTLTNTTSTTTTTNQSNFFNVSQCKYHDAPTRQCYYSDDHLKEEIWNFLEPTVTEWIFLALYVFCFVLGLGGNGLVVWAVVHNSHLRSTTNVLLTNLAVADFLAVLVCMPPNFVQTIWETWFLGEVMCKVVSYYRVILIVVSILTLTAISVERYCAICRPMTFKQTRARVVGCLVFVWLSAHLAALPRLFVVRLHHDDLIPPNVTVLLTSCAPSAAMAAVALHYEIFLCVVFYALPIVVMGYTYTAVALCLRSSAKTGILTETESKANQTQLNARRRTAKMLIVVVIVFIVCFLPVYIWNMIRLVAPESLVFLDPHLVSGITLGSHLLLLINSCINPLIYNFMSAKFRREFQAACHCFSCLFRSARNVNSFGLQDRRKTVGVLAVQIQRRSSVPGSLLCGACGACGECFSLVQCGESFSLLQCEHHTNGTRHGSTMTPVNV
ncbi:orexin/Hypocretin receptor type 1-like [Babylonia areolata]|uniref:orexin/Hypocretin receptor type 1-like n=1 Tax=Babylonia areolata TaxID=304850 RepID=UPI003FD40448